MNQGITTDSGGGFWLFRLLRRISSVTKDAKQPLSDQSNGVDGSLAEQLGVAASLEGERKAPELVIDYVERFIRIPVFECERLFKGNFYDDA